MALHDLIKIPLVRGALGILSLGIAFGIGVYSGRTEGYEQGIREGRRQLHPTQMRIADLNGDGFPDAAYRTQASETERIFLAEECHQRHFVFGYDTSFPLARYSGLTSDNCDFVEARERK